MSHVRQHMDGWMDGWMMDGWMYGWMYGWMDGWMDGWTELLVNHRKLHKITETCSLLDTGCKSINIYEN